MINYHNDPNSLKNYGKSFYWASFFLPNQSKSAATELYSICRYFDDIADNNLSDQSNLLKNEFNNIQNDNNHPIKSFFKKNKIPISVLEDLIKGLLKDQKEVKIKNEFELIEYSYQVAGTVGLMMSPLILVTEKDAKKHAIDLGIAMQLTNIARDIYEDAKMGRVYLPEEWLGDIDIMDLQNPLTTSKKLEIKKVIQKLLNLAELYYHNGFSGMKYIPIKTRLGIFFAAKIYREIGQKIKKNGYKYSSERTFISNINKALVALISIPEFLFLKYLNNSYNPLRKKFDNEDL
tara:strand:+ start:1970 stop:2842 length:873 start_codon:yes stop_codon:yes gene_type:complete